MHLDGFSAATRMCKALGINPAVQTRGRCMGPERAILVYALRSLTTWSYPEIARAVGHKYHSGAMNSYQRAVRLREELLGPPQ